MLTADTMDAYIALFGLNDRNISMIEQECSVHIALRGNQLQIQGEAEHLRIAEETIHILFGMIERNEPVDRVRIRYVISMVKEGNGDRIEESLRKVIAITHRGKQVTCKTLGQQQYIDTIRKNTLKIQGVRGEIIDHKVYYLDEKNEGKDEKKEGKDTKKMKKNKKK